jgi:hypothetical protein
MENIDKKIEERYKHWLSDNEMSNNLEEINNDIKKSFREFILSNAHQVEEIDITKYVEKLRFGLSNIKLYFSKDTYYVYGIAEFTKFLGGRIGLVHGGGSFFILNLALKIFCDKVYQGKILSQKFKTTYIEKIHINSFLKIKVSSSQISEDEAMVFAKLLNNNGSECAKLESKVNFRNSKF